MIYTIQYDKNRKPEEIKILSDGLAQDSKKRMGFPPTEYFNFFVRDENQKIFGGCNGSIFYGSIYVRLLWVDESLRGKGYGKKLMQHVEALAKTKQCAFIALQTMEWGALDFFTSLGYEVEFMRVGYQKNTVAYLLRKNL